MSIVVKEQPPRPKAPGFYTRLVVKTMYHGTWYSAWEPFAGNGIQDIEAEIRKLDKKSAFLSLYFQNAHANKDECELEYVILPVDVLNTSIITMQMVQIKRPKGFAEEQKAT